MNPEPVNARPHRAGYTAAMTQASPRSSFVLREADYRRMRWKNGAGWTSEILRSPDVDDWRWRLSIAEIEADAPFSTYPGVDRDLVLLSGNGMRLRFDDGSMHELLPPHGALRFPGERRLVGQPIDGCSRDFNVMWKRGQADVQLWRRPLVGAMVLFAAAGETWVVHMLAGQAHFTGDCALAGLERGDTAVLQGNVGMRARFALDGAGEALLVRITEDGEG